MKVIADLQIHSKYSRAVSQEMVLPKIWEWAKRKGIGLVATGDWTHPLWLREIKTHLEERGDGVLQLRSESLPPALKAQKKEISEKGPFFFLATEVSSIYTQGGKLRRIHNLVWAPSLAVVEKINRELVKRGGNLLSDGRPIFGLTSRQIAELIFSLEKECLLIPAHIWTPHFSLYGSVSGFDSLEECFGEFSSAISAVETGLSSSPAMNWRIKELDTRAILSFSDAHSGPKLGREATVFELEKLSYQTVKEAICSPGKNKIAYTIEFYPEEGKYHFSGHRKCGVRQSPKETREKGAVCPVCGRKLTIGVMERVEELASRKEEDLKLEEKIFGNQNQQIRFLKSQTFPQRPPFVMLVPLLEILAEALESLPSSQSVLNEYQKLTDYFGGEFFVLLTANLREIARLTQERVAEAIKRVRLGEIVVEPGYDGVFGQVKIWPQKEKKSGEKEKKEQMSLF